MNLVRNSLIDIVCPGCGAVKRACDQLCPDCNQSARNWADYHREGARERQQEAARDRMEELRRNGAIILHEGARDHDE